MITRFRADTGLLLVDCQQGVDDLTHWGGSAGQRNNPEAEERMLGVLAAWRARELPAIFTLHDSRERNSPLKLSRPGGASKPGFEPHADELVIKKRVNSAFVDTSLESELRRRRINRLVIAGFLTNMSISTTVRMANNLGFDTYLIHDACAATNRRGLDGRNWDAQTVHDLSVATLHGEFCTALDHNEIRALLDNDAPALMRVQGNE